MTLQFTTLLRRPESEIALYINPILQLLTQNILDIYLAKDERLAVTYQHTEEDFVKQYNKILKLLSLLWCLHNA